MKRLAMTLWFATAPAWGQCVMCFRTAAAQNAARGHLLNIGIVLLGVPPFCILAGFLLLAWRRSQAFAGSDEPPDVEPSGGGDAALRAHQHA
jgi:hypothetical protein